MGLMRVSERLAYLPLRPGDNRPLGKREFANPINLANAVCTRNNALLVLVFPSTKAPNMRGRVRAIDSLSVDEGLQRHRIAIRGSVQGVGFRPMVWQLAQELQIAGWVCNDGQGVLIEAQATEMVLLYFESLLRPRAPAFAIIEHLSVETIPVDSSSIALDSLERSALGTFDIRSSVSGGLSSLAIPPDLAPCGECLDEMRDPLNRRFQYPFINCTHCGPRFSILRDVPYDREMTTMQSFAMCDACQREYDSPSDRRFHAQPNACPACGPRVWWLEGSQLPLQECDTVGQVADRAALDACVAAIKRGRIAAIRGIGGFHLACDATSEPAIAKLRHRKCRPDKPLAVMVRDVAMAQRLVEGTAEDWLQLQSPARPIVLLNRRAGVELPNAIAPGMDTLGIVLPSSPLHYLLMAAIDVPLVLTSGNLSDEPIAKDNAEAIARLGSMADGFLLHDRPIQTFCDDSVLRRAGAQWIPIRRARGYAPLPIRLTTAGPELLAVGAELKGAFCMASGEHAYISQHLGDMANLESLRALDQNVDQWVHWLRARPQRLACDLHPGYLVSQWAERTAREQGIEILRVQHHHAHLASLAAEHGWDSGDPLPGFVLDGTGYGTDGTIWGGEVLVLRGSSFERLAQVQPFDLPGGDAAVRAPYRVALGLLRSAGLPWDSREPSVAVCSDAELRLHRQQFERRVGCITTSSMGRLFDAVASLLGIRHRVTYEAQSAMKLEAIASRTWRNLSDHAKAELTCQFVLAETTLDFDTLGLVRSIQQARMDGIPTGELALQFHLAIVAWITRVSCDLQSLHGWRHFGLTGGVFQNALLTELAMQSLTRLGLVPLMHRIVPCNDGGISLGQAWIGRH